MSQEFMDDEIFADFIIEAREHLETIEPNLLKLEKIPNNSALLNDIFRPMHSLKGASGFLGLNKINKLAHRCENILDELRKETMVMTSEIMDVILSATDALSQIIDNLGNNNTEGDVEIDHLAVQIDAIMANNLNDAPQKPVAKQALAPVPELAEPVAPKKVAAKKKAVAPKKTATSADVATPIADNTSNNISPKDWISEQIFFENYKLTAFGAGHLKDFIDESHEIIENLNAGLLSLEELTSIDPELVNDLFRFFHNLKGNSSIIGFNQLNGLTHEAETLLNNVRRGEATVTHELIDLLLFVTDVMESLINCIDSKSCSVTPFNVDELVEKLQNAVAGKLVTLPLNNKPTNDELGDDELGTDTPEGDDDLSNAPKIIPIGLEETVNDIFKATVKQQLEFMKVAIVSLTENNDDKNSIDALYLCLIAIKNASTFLELEELATFADRTSGIVDGARKADMDFGIVLDILSQECEILRDMLLKVMDEMIDEVPVEVQEQIELEVQIPNNQREDLPQSLQPPVLTSNVDKGLTSASAASKVTGQPNQAKSTVEKATPVPAQAKVASSGVKAKAAAQQAEVSGNKSSSTIRVDHEKLDHLMNLIGELIINRNRYSLIARHLEEEENVDVAQVAQSLSETTYAMARISDDLQDTIMKVRMVPVASVFSRFPRLVRDLSRKSGKEVDLILEGEETELDKSVVEVIGDPLVHLIRNSMDHGIEDEATRIARDKPTKGKVVLRAYHRGNSVAIEIEDDGKGIDPEQMREVAVRKGVIDAETAKQLDDREAMELIFAPGFSSAEVITDISGRGVGMDVVRTNIKNLKGSVTIASEVGKGTKFTLILPLTLAIIDALMVEVAGNLYALPLDAVSETTKIESARLTDVKGRKAVTLRGEVIGIIELAEILCLPRKPLPDILSVVVIHDGSRRLGLVVDRLLERQEIVIKPLGSYLGDLRGISGATIMGDGSVILILDPHEVYLLSTSKSLP